MRPVIITGGIASGKSSVCERLAKKGVKIIDADKKAHEILDLHSKDIGRMFGSKYIKDGKVLRATLGEKIFKEKEARERLEDFIHPRVHEALMKEWRECEKKSEVCVLDIPLYFEGTYEYKGFHIVVVSVDQDQQRTRLKKRNNFKEDQIEARLKAQKPLKEKCQNADWVIDNSSDISKLDKKVDDLYNWLINLP